MTARPFLVVLALAAPAAAAELRFDRVVIDDNFPGAYQVEVADVNGDGKPDVVAVGGGTCAWYENPSWKKRLVTTPKQTPGIISSATRDLDGDGKAEIAIAYEFAMNQPTKGKLLLARQGNTVDEPWTVEPVADVPSIHRLRWGHVLERNRWDLVVAPIFGPKAKPPSFQEHWANIELSRPVIGLAPGVRVNWTRGEYFAAGPVLHAIDVVDLDDDGRDEVLAASNAGVTRFSIETPTTELPPPHKVESLTPGSPGVPPKVGSSEVHVGRLKDGRRFLATVEPWHGTEVAVCLSESLTPLKFGPRSVIDATLKEGHALWVADVDGDGDDEIFAGFRGPGTSVLAYDFDGKTWSRTVVDSKIAAQDLRGGDLDGDGSPDVVAVGGSTRNVVWYRPRK